ncbi:MAG: MBL fold metallo-hydrolase [Ornithinimicrobium sp.]|uniref:MBL fold metallo-hydrolase n=1 Tax=Ornithinimicrobium sp. TaxID=1977084 RepID=UPI0026DF83E3|nr:MBL fold metallo-hydrolase [Ornithinimicrobium sp.]MDO5738689.1 MBL fold metallo-hydrolase [Ornithinimicrobium sp.]
MSKPFASSQDLEEKVASIEVLADGVYARTAQGDPNVGAIEGEDFLVCFEALATPAAAHEWLTQLRTYTDKPVRYLVLSHYHAVRVLGAPAFQAQEIVAHELTRELIRERGQQDWDSEYGRMPRLFKEPESISGLTWPTVTFSDRLTIPLGGDRGDLVLQYCGRGHTEGDIVAWLPRHKVLFAGDLVEAQAALYTGDAFHRDWAGAALAKISSFEAEHLVGGRGGVVSGAAVGAAIDQTRHFLTELIQSVSGVHQRGGTLKEAFDASYAALANDYGRWPIFEHTLPFDVSRVWDELSGIERPVIWTADRDQEIWAQLQG